jgi:hypothetical protein
VQVVCDDERSDLRNPPKQASILIVQIESSK